jgi:hypothetical protein
VTTLLRKIFREEASMAMEHAANAWCWCRPKVKDQGTHMAIIHNKVDPPHWMAQRNFAGGREYEDSGCAAGWFNVYP